MTDYDIEFPARRRDKRLGRVKVHDPASRRFALGTTIDTSTWRDKSVRIYDPTPNPFQIIGNCTGCDVAMNFNAVGQRKTGRVLGMAEATKVYQLATRLDPFDGEYPPTDTGSSGLAAAKAAQQLGYGGAYWWLFGGADEIVQAIMDGHSVGIGTWWYEGMFDIGTGGFITPTGALAGGHQYRARGYIEHLDAIILRCWWGRFRDVLIKRNHLNDLVLDGGDSKVQVKP